MTHKIPLWHRGLHAIHFGSLSGLVVLTFMASVMITAVSPKWVKHAEAAVSSFSAGSFWNAPVPAYTALYPGSDALVANIAAQAGQFGQSFNTTSSSPLYVVDGNVPTVPVVPWDCGAGSLPDLSSQWQAVPLPFYAVPGGNPAQLVIYQPSTSTVWEFGHMRNIAGQWQACTGGRTSTSDDGVLPAPYGVSSSGLPLLGGQLRPDELKSGYIDHVIGLSLPQVSGFVPPATQAGGSVAGAPSLGMRFRLDPSIDISSLGLSPAGQAIARAAQTYGFVIWNKSANVSVYGDNPVSYTSRTIRNPYLDIPGVDTALNNFPWGKLQALPVNNYAAVIPAITQFNVSSASIKAENSVTLSWQASNVNRCAIAGVSDDLPATGTIISKTLISNTTFVLRCGGPNGAASSMVSVAVLPMTANDPKAELKPALVIDQPYSGYANVIPEIMSGAAADKVYKVVYYEKNTYLYETAKPPFALNTARMDNGQHNVDAHIYYRDGTSDRKTFGFAVSNTPETLFATSQSGIIKSPSAIPWPYAITGIVIALLAILIGTRWGWHKSHLN